MVSNLVAMTLLTLREWQNTDTHKRETSMPPEGFEPAFSARQQPQTYALDRAASRIDPCIFDHYLNYKVEPEMAQSTIVMSLGIIRISWHQFQAWGDNQLGDHFQNGRVSRSTCLSYAERRLCRRDSNRQSRCGLKVYQSVSRDFRNYRATLLHTLT